MQSLTYLSVLYRLRRQTEQAEQYALRGLEHARAARLRVYEGAALANLAWIELQCANLGRAKELGQAGLALMQADNLTFPFQWLALLPLIAVALASNQLSAATEYAQTLLDARQQRLPDQLADTIAEALQAMSAHATDRARRILLEAVAANSNAKLG